MNSGPRACFCEIAVLAPGSLLHRRVVLTDGPEDECEKQGPEDEASVPSVNIRLREKDASEDNDCYRL